MKKKDVKVSLKDLYQMMISDTRYGYTRNNGLMPDGAFDHCRTYLPLMAREDADYAAHTARQLAEEAIWEVLDYSRREEEARFWLDVKEGDEPKKIEPEWVPTLYRRTCACEFEAKNGIVISLGSSAEGSSEERKDVLKISKLIDSGHLLLTYSQQEGYFGRLYKQDLRPGWWFSVGDIYNKDGLMLQEGESLFFEIYETRPHHRPITDALDYRAYMEFIEFCLRFLESAEGDTLYPYNYYDYLKFKLDHPMPKKESDQK